MHGSCAEATVQKRQPQATLRQIPDPGSASGGVAPGHLRDQQFCQGKENGRRKHQHRKNHTADGAEGGKRRRGGAVECQPFWNHEIFQRVDADFQVIRQRQWHRCP